MAEPAQPQPSELDSARPSGVRPLRVVSPSRSGAPVARREPLWRHMLGDQLRRLRLERGETLGETAARAGVSLPYLSEIERGVKEPSSEMIAAVAGALGVGLVDLTMAVSERLRSERADGAQHSPAPVVTLSARSQGAVLLMAA